MAECILTRTTTISDEILNPIQPIPGVCILNVKVVDVDNKPIQNVRVQCKDGGQTYVYNTNEKGLVRFSTNSGQCNLYFNNYLSNNAYIMDYTPINHNMVEAPVGTVVNKTFNLPYRNYASFGPMGSSNWCFLSTSSVNFNMAAGGGGGSGGLVIQSWPYNGFSGGRGGNLTKNGFAISKSEQYQIYVGSGGSGSAGNSQWDPDSTYRASVSWGGSGGSTMAFSSSVQGGVVEVPLIDGMVSGLRVEGLDRVMEVAD